MSGDYETLEINQPKISYLKKRSEDDTLWLDEMINEIDDRRTTYLLLNLGWFVIAFVY